MGRPKREGFLVYCITCLTTGRKYIGITVGKLRRRWAGHLYSARNGHSAPLYREMRRHGIENFSVAVLYEGVDLREIQAVERGLICQYGTHISSGGFNLTTGGEGNFDAAGVLRGESTKQALLNEAVVQFIRDPVNAQISNREIVALVAEQFCIDVSRDCLRDARRGDTWVHLNPKFPPIRIGQGCRATDAKRAQSRRNLSLPHVQAASAAATSQRMRGKLYRALIAPDIARLIFCASGSLKVISSQYGASVSVVKSIRARRSWKQVTEGLIRG